MANLHFQLSWYNQITFSFSWFSCSSSILVKLLFTRNFGFCRGSKTGVPGKITLRAMREPTTNSVHIWHWSGLVLVNTRGRGRRSNHCNIPGPCELRLRLLLVWANSLLVKPKVSQSSSTGNSWNTHSWSWLQCLWAFYMKWSPGIKSVILKGMHQPPKQNDFNWPGFSLL